MTHRSTSSFASIDEFVDSSVSGLISSGHSPKRSIPMTIVPQHPQVDKSPDAGRGGPMDYAWQPAAGAAAWKSSIRFEAGRSARFRYLGSGIAPKSEDPPDEFRFRS